MGFETVTIAYEGAIAHHDSTGNSGVIGPGDVQWMTAGAGILHKEYHEKTFAQTGGVMHMMQIWVNLPKVHKSAAPKYQAIQKEQINSVPLPNEGGEVRIIAGEFQGVKGPAATFTPINLFDIRLNRSGKARMTLQANYNTAVMVLHGGVTINRQTAAEERDFVLFSNEDGDIVIEGATDAAAVLLFNGEPIDEPIVQYGPFVMNTRQEISQAIEDFNNGKFGYLE
jgi:redox-sensitive bicupin YhaK (pirin superfamily)